LSSQSPGIGFKVWESKAKTIWHSLVTADSCSILSSQIPEKEPKERAIEPSKWDSSLLEARARAKAKKGNESGDAQRLYDRAKSNKGFMPRASAARRAVR